MVQIARKLIVVGTCVLALLALPARSHALFHIAVIDEMLASIDGDPEQQFLEVRMLFAAQNLTRNAVIAAFDADGNYIADILVIPDNVPTGANGARWIAATSAFQSARGFTADFTMPARIPLGGGMVCFGAPGIAAPDPSTWDHTRPENYVDCLAYGTYDGPRNEKTGTPTTLVAEGHSLVRQSETEDNARDFTCAAVATPTNNAGATIDVDASTRCAVVRASGVQVTPDEQGVLVNKDVGTQRWTITRNLDDLTVTGNVFSTEGAPLFVFCEQQDAQGESLVLACSGADACSDSECPAFSFIANVTLPRFFFLPPASAAAVASAVEAAVATARDGAGGHVPSGGATPRQSGIQVTPDAKRVLVSKDVASQRWSIARDEASGTVTGNVFATDGGAPLFLSCEQTGATPAEVELRCSSADACSETACPPFAFIADVTLPRSFFALPQGEDPNRVPTSGVDLFAWLQAGRYRGFAAESGVHASAGPHGGGVRTFLNDVLAESLAAGAAAHPTGAAAVKELYAADRTTLTGWAVEVKVQDESAGGQGWYWYEVFSTTDGSRPIEGLGNPVCTGCHAQGRDYVRIPFPLQ